MSRLVFVDTETTSLRPDRRMWDIALIVRDGVAEAEFQWFIAKDDLDLGNADPFSLRVGRFYERHPDFGEGEGSRQVALRERDVLEEIERLTRGAHLVGAVVSFDAEVLAARMRAHGILPSWHYHLIDVEALAVGYLHGLADRPVPPVSVAARLPWDSEDLSWAVGVKPPPEDVRHTAIEDARWAMRMYYAITGGAAPKGASSDG